MSIWALHDFDEKLKLKGAINITKQMHDLRRLEDDAQRGNRKGYGIFWVVNDMVDETGARKVENLKKINYWYCDIDEGTKEEQKARIEALLIPPSFVVETAKGYHCYWGVKGTATLENFAKIEDKLIELLKGDKHCKDPLRLLRCPGYYHMKRPAHPFLCQIVEGIGSELFYEEQKMLNWLCREEKKSKPVTIPKVYISDKNDFLDPKKWDKIFKPSEIVKGNRNGMLTRYTFWMKDEGFAPSEVRYIIEGLNDKFIEPLPKRELEQLLRSKGV